jgi:hypothetical protein
MKDRRRVPKTGLGEEVQRERMALQRKLAQIRAWLGVDCDTPVKLAALSGRVREHLAALPEDRRRLLRSNAGLAIADLRESGDALQRYLDLVQEDLQRRGSHAAAAKAYGTQPSGANARLRRNRSGG